ncbi:MAG: class I SAM-dependent methyltransferase [Chloroflexi bacterium]|nr:class I SAM-dependent methyltransferase [Chloroflexota bacterium]
MSDDNLFQDLTYLQQNQYRTSNNLDSRAALHRQFSTAIVRWQPWVFAFLGLKPRMRVLECGCGPGWLWRENLDRIPTDCHITLTDLSSGMVAEAEAALADSSRNFEFQQANIETLDFEDESFDLVVANHMLYHVPNLAQGLAEVRRVLRPNGRFIAATNGNDHMKELADLIPVSLSQLSTSFRVRGKGEQLSFRLENGRSQLTPFFDTIDLHLYEDSLHITEVEPLLAYAFSMMPPGIDMPETAVSQLRNAWSAQITADDAIDIGKHSGLFVAAKRNP